MNNTNKTNKKLLMISINKIISLIIIFISIFVVGAEYAYAATTTIAPSTISMGSAGDSMNYIESTKFPIKYMSNGTITYCLDHDLALVQNQTLSRASVLDAGIAYIIKNGYPVKSITGNNNYDYYITQTALWWYLDETTGTSSLPTSFKTTSSDPQNLRPRIIALKNAALNNRNYSVATMTLNITNGNQTLKYINNYYVSETIGVNSSNLEGQYAVSVKNAPAGTLILDANNTQRTSYSSNERFTIKIPATSFEYGITNMVIEAKAVGAIEKAYKYSPTNTSVQSVTPVTLFKEKTDLNSSISLTATKTPPVKPPVTPPVTSKNSTVSINKIDELTGLPLVGAEFVIKNSLGIVVVNFVSATTPYNISTLPIGNYTLEEIKAPVGYVLSNEIISFEIKADNNALKLVMKNTKYVEVPNTASSGSMIIYIIGTLITLGSAAMIYSGVKKVY